MVSTHLKVLALSTVAVLNLFFFNQFGGSLEIPTAGITVKGGMYTVEDRRTRSLEILEGWTKDIPVLARITSKRTTEERLPSTEQPFYFFHMRKAGGSTIRDFLNEASLRFGWPAWIACHTHPCLPFTVPPTKGEERFALYASHINYVQMQQILMEQSIPVKWGPQRNWEKKNPLHETLPASAEGDENNHTFYSSNSVEEYMSQTGTCVTNIRPTVSRVYSCWNYRMIQNGRKDWNLPQSGNMTAQDWYDLLPLAMDTYGNGCSNEAARIFGSQTFEQDVNTLGLQDDRFNTELDRVFSRMGRCVVIRVDRCEDSNRILKHYLPWLEADLCGKQLRQSQIAPRADTDFLPDDVQQAILERNWFDEMAFRFAEELFEEQLRVAEAELALHPDGHDKILDRIKAMNVTVTDATKRPPKEELKPWEKRSGSNRRRMAEEDSRRQPSPTLTKQQRRAAAQQKQAARQRLRSNQA